MKKKKEWKDLTIADNFIFGKVLENDPVTCKLLLETILDFKIDEISYPEREKAFETRHDSKGIRLDVFVKTPDGKKMYDIEIQTSNNDNLAKRMRYYQGLIDNDSLEKGKHYWQLGTSYIIFVCTFDYFRRGNHFYSFRERCDQDPDLLMGDETVKIFLNAKGKKNDVSNDLLDFLNYINGKKSENPLVTALDEEVQKVKRNKEWRNDYMRYEEHIAAEAHWRALEMAEEMAEEKAKKIAEESVERVAKEATEEATKNNTLANLKSIIKNAKVTAEKAMDILEIPQVERPEYKILLES